MIDVRCPICKNRHSCMEIGINASEGCGMFALDDPPKRPQTNADRIRSMTDEELARWLTKTQRIGDVEVFCDGYYQLWLDWLKEEVADG